MNKHLTDLYTARCARIDARIAQLTDPEQIFTTARLKGLGGSDMAILMRESKWGTPYGLWLEKTERRVKTFSNTLPLETGHALEEFVAQKYSQITGYKVVKAKTCNMGPEAPYLQGNFDRLVMKDGKIIKGLECKTTASNNKVYVNGTERPTWGNGNIYENGQLVAEDNLIDPKYYAQVQFYLMVSGLTEWDVAVLIANHTFRIFTVHEDAEYQDRMYQVACNFFEQNVLEDIAPAMALSDKVENTELDKTRIMQADADIFQLVREYKEANTELLSAENKVNALKEQISSKMGDNAKIVYTDEKGKEKTLASFAGGGSSSTEITSFDFEAFKAKYPEIFSKYAGEFLKTEIKESHRKAYLKIN